MPPRTLPTITLAASIAISLAPVDVPTSPNAPGARARIEALRKVLDEVGATVHGVGSVDLAQTFSDAGTAFGDSFSNTRK